MQSSTFDGPCNTNFAAPSMAAGGAMTFGHNNPPPPTENRREALQLAIVREAARKGWGIVEIGYALVMTMYMGRDGQGAYPSIRDVTRTVSAGGAGSTKTTQKYLDRIADGDLIAVQDRGPRRSKIYSTALTFERELEIYCKKIKLYPPEGHSSANLSPTRGHRLENQKIAPATYEIESPTQHQLCPPGGHSEKSGVPPRGARNRETRLETNNPSIHRSRSVRRRTEVMEVEEHEVVSIGLHNDAHKSEQFDIDELSKLATEFDTLFAPIPVANREFMVKDIKEWLGLEITDTFRQILFIARDCGAGNLKQAYDDMRTVRMKSNAGASRFKYFHKLAYGYLHGSEHQTKRGFVSLQHGGRPQISRGQAL